MQTAHVGTQTAPTATAGTQSAPTANADLASRTVHVATPEYDAPAGHTIAHEAAHGVGVIHDAHV
jgi:hypothetical protein